MYWSGRPAVSQQPTAGQGTGTQDHTIIRTVGNNYFFPSLVEVSPSTLIFVLTIYAPVNLTARA